MFVLGGVEDQQGTEYSFVKVRREFSSIKSIYTLALEKQVYISGKDPTGFGVGLKHMKSGQ